MADCHPVNRIAGENVDGEHKIYPDLSKVEEAKMKRSITAVLTSLIFVLLFLGIPTNQTRVIALSNVAQLPLKVDQFKDKYPDSELLAGQKIQLATCKINRLNQQIVYFQPDLATSLSYIENTVAYIKELSATLYPVHLDLPAVSMSASSVRAPVSINMIYYGSNSGGIDQKIIAAHPEFLVNNSPVGPQKGDANISEYMAAGIKYFEYLDGGYEGTVSRSIPNDLQSNLNYITAANNAGAYGIFLDEVSSYPGADSLSYLRQISKTARTLGLKIVFNTGVASWSDQLMNYCDYMNSSETWRNNTLTKSQEKYRNRVWLETQEVTDATTAANLTKTAWDKGIKAAYVCEKYITLPDWLDDYISQIKSYSTLNLSFIVFVAVGTGLVILATALLVWRKHSRGG